MACLIFPPPVPVCPHAGGVGLCELVQHLILFDYICVSGSLSSRYEQIISVTTRSSVICSSCVLFIAECVNM